MLSNILNVYTFNCNGEPYSELADFSIKIRQKCRFVGSNGEFFMKNVRFIK